MANDTAEIKFKYLRHCIGLLGLALPTLILFVAKVAGDCDCLQDSISHYYYTVSGPVFVGILWGLGLVLIFYPTPKTNDVLISACIWRICRVFKPKLDGTLTTIAGLFAICVSLFPTYAMSNDSCAIFKYCDSDLRAGFHYFSAGAMLLIFSYMSICIFTRTNDKDWRTNKWKVRRNKVYIWSGVLTFLSVAAVGVFAILEKLDYNIPTKSTYWLEVCALVPFGISWLVKGEFILTDENEPSTVGKMKNLITTGKLEKKNDPTKQSTKN